MEMCWLCWGKDFAKNNKIIYLSLLQVQEKKIPSMQKVIVIIFFFTLERERESERGVNYQRKWRKKIGY